MSGQGEVAVRDRIGGIEGDRLVQQTPRLAQVVLGEASDVPMRPHHAVPRVKLARSLVLGVPDLGRDDAGSDGAGNALRDLVLDGKHVSQLAIVAVRP